MELNPYLHHWISQERGADALRDAKKYRLIKSLKEHGTTRRWLQRLGLVSRDDAPAYPRDAGEPRPKRRRAAASPTH